MWENFYSQIIYSCKVLFDKSLAHGHNTGMIKENEKDSSCLEVNLLEYDYPGLEKFMKELGEPPFRAMQVWQWIWQRMARDFEQMSNISKVCRAKLAERAVIVWPEIERIQKSSDGTTKFLLRLADGEHVETVIIPSEGRDGKTRISQCLSCQVGCAMGCAFCATGQMGLIRNMTMGEILGQVLVARDYLGDTRLDWPILRNLVFMGMGEPLANLDNVIPALQVLNHDKGLNFSPRRITVSTCGLKNGLERLGESGLAFLAVSLHAPDQDLRSEIMPIAAKWPLDEMLDALASYPLKTRERITFEYLLLGGINDSPRHAKKLAALMGKVKGKLNLIVYNSSPGSTFKAPSEDTVLAFEKILWNHNITAIRRKSKGGDIAAACGQLCAKFSRQQ